MQSVASAFGSRLTLRLLLAGCLAALLVGCADSERLSGPFSNPFQGDADRTPTASIGAPTGSVQSRPLAPPAQGTATGRVATYTAAAYPTERVGSAQSIAGWTAEGGTPIVMAQGETAGIIATRYGIPLAALLKTNGFASSAQVRPGTRLIIPTYNAAFAASSGARFASRDMGRPPAGARLRFVKWPQPKKLEKSAKAHSKKPAQMNAERSTKAEKSAKLAKPHSGRLEANAAKTGTIVAEAEAQPKKPVELKADVQSRARRRQDRFARIPLAGAWPDHSSL